MSLTCFVWHATLPVFCICLSFFHSSLLRSTGRCKGFAPSSRQPFYDCLARLIMPQALQTAPTWTDSRSRKLQLSNPKSEMVITAPHYGHAQWSASIERKVDDSTKGEVAQIANWWASRPGGFRCCEVIHAILKLVLHWPFAVDLNIRVCCSYFFTSMPTSLANLQALLVGCTLYLDSLLSSLATAMLIPKRNALCRCTQLLQAEFHKIVTRGTRCTHTLSHSESHCRVQRKGPWDLTNCACHCFVELGASIYWSPSISLESTSLLWNRDWAFTGDVKAWAQGPTCCCRPVATQLTQWAQAHEQKANKERNERPLSQPLFGNSTDCLFPWRLDRAQKADQCHCMAERVLAWLRDLHWTDNKHNIIHSETILNVNNCITFSRMKSKWLM